MLKPSVSQRRPLFGPSLATPNAIINWVDLNQKEVEEKRESYSPAPQTSPCPLWSSQCCLVPVQYLHQGDNCNDDGGGGGGGYPGHLFLSGRLATQVIASQALPSEIHLCAPQVILHDPMCQCRIIEARHESNR